MFSRTREWVLSVVERRKPKQPNRPNANRLPVDVRSYFKKGKMVKGYKRRKAGDAVEEKK